MVAAGEDELELKFIRESLQRGHVTSSEDFASRLSDALGIDLPNRFPGRQGRKKETGAEAPVS